MDTPVVMINGLIGCLDHPAFHHVLGPRRVIAPDLLGYGRLDDTPSTLIDIDAQVEHLRRSLEAHNLPCVHLLGHSVGGVVAMLFAQRYPANVASVISVEGNFTLKDAFWSASVARMASAEAEAMLQGYRADAGAWLARSGIMANASCLTLAGQWLAHQPASTLQAMARSVVAVTGVPGYLDGLRRLFATKPVHLFAGEHSRAGWDVPSWAEEQAASFTVLPRVGHLMMLEDPQGFASAIARLLD
ncbi:alpha/beta fold hydrolase [Pseudomonas sp. CCOS 191]|uniref:alpha/beta fold hydrolase n=1 Tax=Pseudomonas sp. CCOS 191 TaxID=1649877 RepID=UPI000624E1C0|nr:alpha/beta hydrolase [Pseudomonas sp. CCOS 191]CRI57871.1 alpha/beta hydrolase [Pseudomonas sp. CCOS 191]